MPIANLGLQIRNLSGMSAGAMDKILIALTALLILSPTNINGTTFTRCGLATKLKSLGFSDLGNWVCLAEAESSLNSNVRGKRNSNGSYDYGIFQINDGYWCSTTSTPGKDCKVTCASLLDNDITNDAACAKIIHKRHGFSAWYGWKAKCQGKNVSSYIRGCGV